MEGNAKDSKFLTKSTLNNDEGLPSLTMQDRNGLLRSNNNGYISDFYKKKQFKNDNHHPLSDSSYHSASIDKKQSGPYHQIEFSNEVVPTNGNPANKLKKIDSKKFFKSKIDFAAPIKILQNRGTQETQLSDDSYNELN